MTELGFRPAVELCEMLRKRAISSRELLDYFLDRVDRFNPDVNAIVTLDAERARKIADDADAYRARGEIIGPLHGLPMTVKDNLETADVRSTAGAKHLADHVPEVDSTVVHRLKAAGAIVFGKTNLPPMGMDPQTFNDLFGTTNNPWDRSRTPGGSSGGAAAALAAGLTGLEVGTDIGGSIRQPASHCGVYGHKPTYGIVPRRGHLGVPGARHFTDLSCIGPMGRGAADLMLGLDVLAGPSIEEHGIAARLDLPAPRHDAVRDFRVAAWFDVPQYPTDTAVRGKLDEAVLALRAAGVQVDEEARPDFDPVEVHRNYIALLGATSSAGVRDDLFDMYVEACKHLPDDGSYPAMFPRAFALRHRDWMRASEFRAQVRVRWLEFFQDYDVLLAPVTCVPAYPHNQEGGVEVRFLRVNGEDRPYLEQIFWAGFANHAHLPATSVPVGRTDDGLPVGMQVIGPYQEDRTPIHFARLLEDVVGGFTPPPGF